MRATTFLLFIVLINGCGGGGKFSAEQIEILGKSLTNVVRINGTDGIDEKSYTLETVFKTITYALIAVKNKDVFPDRVNLLVEEGYFSEAYGEIFPLILDSDVSIYGVSNVIIESLPVTNTSSNTTTSVMHIIGDSTVYNLRISSDKKTIGISVEAGSPVIFDNRITENATAISMKSDSTPLIDSNTIKNNIKGIETYDSSHPKLSNNNITENDFGISVFDSSAPNLGTTEEFGNNTILSNKYHDLCNFSGSSISAIGNDWHKSTELIIVKNICTSDFIIGSIFPPGNILLATPPPGNSLVFQVDGTINLTSPTFRKIIDTDTPSFAWEMNDANLVALGVFSVDIEFEKNSIRNTDKLVFYWDSGLGKGRVGSIAFEDGQRVDSGIFQTASEALPLVRGKSYHWAVWAWDDTGKHIVQSSQEGFFTIRQ